MNALGGSFVGEGIALFDDRSPSKRPRVSQRLHLLIRVCLLLLRRQQCTHAELFERFKILELKHWRKC